MTQLVGFTELGGELVMIRTGRPAHHVELAMIADMASEVVPGPVVSHRPFDGEEAAVIVGNDEEERLGWGVSLSGMAGILPRRQW